MKKFIVGVDDLATTHPELAKEWHPTLNGDMSTNSVLAGSGIKVWWKCAKGHEWQTAVKNRKKGAGCHYCTGQLPISGVNDLQTLFPEVAARWHPTKNGELTPDKIAAYSNKYVWWKCDKDHSTETKVNNKTLGRGCGVCANRIVLAGYNDLATTDPKVADDWDYERNSPETPSTVLGGASQVEYWWKCKGHGHSWEISVWARTSGRGCPVCANREIVVGHNDLATTNPHLAAEFNVKRNGGVKPTEIVAGSPTFYWWLCAEGHEWETSPNIRWRQNTNCPMCSNRQVSATNNLEVLFPYLLAEWDYEKNVRAMRITFPRSTLRW